MTFRSICIAVYVFFYLIFTTPMRARLKKLEKTDPQEASRIAQEQVQKVFKHLLKISGVTIEVNGLENIPDEALQETTAVTLTSSLQVLLFPAVQASLQKTVSERFPDFLPG